MLLSNPSVHEFDSPLTVFFFIHILMQIKSRSIVDNDNRAPRTRSAYRRCAMTVVTSPAGRVNKKMISHRPLTRTAGRSARAGSSVARFEMRIFAFPMTSSDSCSIHTDRFEF
ncbi:hypothetical protein EVAR_22331_1 [Eumeta japonica]|uniref:Uncharacterized protein n=1 Tax=Eumeta variegata TaxID=151549 RepID=A0A4C1UAQ4_EUMVA|nr:hypothetical protein EVAR_22331_1 [Eumeta japonica]